MHVYNALPPTTLLAVHLKPGVFLNVQLWYPVNMD